MEILQLTKKFPYPIKDGEVIAIHNLSNSYKTLGAELTLLCMNTPKHYFKIEELPDDYQIYKTIHVVEVDTAVKPIPAFFNLFSSESYHISRFDSPDYHEKLTTILQKENFDVIQLETLFLAPYINTIRKYSKAKIVLRAHNIEHEIWERITKNTTFLPKRWYLKLLSRRLAIFEKEQLNNCDLLLPITQRDLDYARSFGFNKKAFVTPIGLNAAKYKPDNSSFQKPFSLSFIGSLDWMPNVEGLNWFLDKIWPKVKSKHPTISLHLAGRNTPDSLYQLESNQLKVLGEIQDAKAFINAHSLMLVPLLSGSGMRVKILEGMALGKVVLSTTVGLEGIIGKDKETFLIANTPEEFIEALDYCYENPEAIKLMGAAARKVILKEYDNKAIGKRVLSEFGE